MEMFTFSYSCSIPMRVFTSVLSIYADLNAKELNLFLTPFDLNRLKKYTENLIDYHMIIDLIPTLARLYFLGQLNMSLNESKSVSSSCALSL